MKKAIILGVLMLAGWTGSLLADTGELHGVVGAEYDSKYVWRGFTVYGSKSAIHPFIDLDLFGTGFGFNVTGHRANSNGYELSERWDYTLYYHGQMFADESYATNYVFGYRYYNFPDLSSHNTSCFPNGIDLQELHGVFSFPKLLGVEGLVPTYVLVKMWPSNSDSFVGDRSSDTPFHYGGTASGFAHIFMLDYGWKVTCPITNQERVVNLHSEVVYNDGVAPNAMNVDHDWSDAVFGVSTDVDLGSNLIFTPGLFHQVTMDKSVNDEKSITWASLILKYKF
jgi:hypothetical protein